MKKISLPEASQVTSPNPLVLVCTQRPDGATNLAAVSWWTYLSYNPNMVAYAMAKTSYSGERVRETGKVILAVPGKAIAKGAMGCGTVSGRNCDKAEKFGLEMDQLEGWDIKIPHHTALAIGCRLKEFQETGDHYLYICEVDQVWADAEEEALFAWNGYGSLAPATKSE